MEMVLYTAKEGDVSINAYIKDETLWVTQKTMAELFGVQVPAISKHLKNIFMDGELDEEVVISKMKITTSMALLREKHRFRRLIFIMLTRLYLLDIE